MYRTGETAKRNDTGAHVQVIEVVPVGTTVFYRVEYENGDNTLVQERQLRPVVVQSIARRAA